MRSFACTNAAPLILAQCLDITRVDEYTRNVHGKEKYEACTNYAHIILVNIHERQNKAIRSPATPISRLPRSPAWSDLFQSKVSTWLACAIRLRPSKLNGLVTTPTVRAPASLATSATTGAAPDPAPHHTAPHRRHQIWELSLPLVLRGSMHASRDKPRLETRTIVGTGSECTTLTRAGTPTTYPATSATPIHQSLRRLHIYNSGKFKFIFVYRYHQH